MPSPRSYVRKSQKAREQRSARGDGPCSLCQALLEQRGWELYYRSVLIGLVSKEGLGRGEKWRGSWIYTPNGVLRIPKHSSSHKRPRDFMILFIWNVQKRRIYTNIQKRSVKEVWTEGMGRGDGINCSWVQWRVKLFWDCGWFTSVTILKKLWFHTWMDELMGDKLYLSKVV